MATPPTTPDIHRLLELVHEIEDLQKTVNKQLEGFKRLLLLEAGQCRPLLVLDEWVTKGGRKLSLKKAPPAKAPSAH